MMRRLKSRQQIYLALRELKCEWRRLIYRVPNVHRTTYLSSGCRLSKDLLMGPYGYLGSGAQIAPGVCMGAYVMFGPQVLIVGRDHRVDIPGVAMIFSGRPKSRRTIVEDDVWIGARSVIITGVRIGRGAVVAAGSLVNKDIAPYSIVGGVPAKLLRYRFNEEEQALHESMLQKPPTAGQFCEEVTV